MTNRTYHRPHRKRKDFTMWVMRCSLSHLRNICRRWLMRIDDAEQFVIDGNKEIEDYLEDTYNSLVRLKRQLTPGCHITIGFRNSIRMLLKEVDKVIIHCTDMPATA